MLEPIVKWFEMVSETSKLLPGIPMVYAGVFGSPLYSGDLDNGLVWYSDNEHLFDHQMVVKPNGI